MELRQLRYFVTLSETLNFRNAAALLSATQPAITQSIQALESDLGVQLFERSQRGVQLTEAGKAFKRDTQRILFDLENAAKKAHEVHSGNLTALNVAGWTGLLLAYFPQILTLFRASYPDVAVNLSSTRSTRGLEALHRHEVDLAIVREVPESVGSDINVERLWEHPFVVILPASHPASSNDTVALKELSGEKLITFPRTTHVYDQVMALSNDVGFVPSSVSEVRDIEATVTLVACGGVIAIVPAPLKGMAIKEVAFKAISEPTNVRVSTCAFWRKTSSSEFIERFLEIARRVNTHDYV